MEDPDTVSRPTRLTGELIRQYSKLDDKGRETLTAFGKAFPDATLEWISPQQVQQQRQKEERFAEYCEAVTGQMMEMKNNIALLHAHRSPETLKKLEQWRQRAETAERAGFFKALFQPSDGLIELRALPSKQRKFVRPGDDDAIARFCRQHWQQNLYFGVAARKDARNGRLENCLIVRCLFADLDFKRFTSPEEARKRLLEFRRPSFSVHSGGGLHLFWLLEEPIDLQQPGAAGRFRELLCWTAQAIGADPKSAEAAHILRIPRTLNYKYSPPREVKLVT